MTLLFEESDLQFKKNQVGNKMDTKSSEKNLFVSKRILLFKSKKNGYLFFCGNSNSFYQLEDENVPYVKKMIEENDDSCLPEEIRQDFIKSGVLLNEDDDSFFNRMKFLSYRIRFSKSQLALTIAPTMACNFKCVYCFEGDRAKDIGSNNVTMSEETLNQLIEFIRKSGAKKLNVYWYGGEPLCAWNKIKEFNEKITSLNLEKYEQRIVTNGSLIDEEKIKYFAEQQFKQIQITLDGKEETHNKNRPMKNGDNSYQSVMKALDLSYKYYKETNIKLPIVIRVNISKENSDEYYELYTKLNEEYENLFFVYPAFVRKNSNGDKHASSCLNFTDEAEFILKLAKEKNIGTSELFPKSNRLISCGANLVNNYVVNSNGDLYKCWEDIGEKKYCIGNIFEGTKDEKNNNYDYVMTASGFEVGKCKDCLFLYSCLGGCPRVILKNIAEKEEVNSICSNIKKNPEEFLETYFELKK
ncbi:radical SAM/SPASM domain-containing protein [Treponema bryantii]|uniref:radical SAM/SPASM domain-containing protein n=1 Tax=Treponema bryantii TaxID=163 RepID=UPI0030C879F2